MDAMDGRSGHPLGQAWSRNLATAIPVALMLVQVALQAHQLSLGLAHVATALYRDDTFYYLLPAWNAHRLGFVTFDGIHPTNGVQLLWFAVAWLAAAAVSSKGTLALVVLAGCIAANALCHLVVLRACTAMGWRGLAPLLSLLWFAVCLSTPLYLRGMENSLHALVSWLAVWQMALLFSRLQRGRTVSLLPITAVLVANAWTRLDSTIVSAAMYGCAVAAVTAHLRRHATRSGQLVRTVAPSAALVLGGGVVLAAIYWRMGGSVVPVSALLKTSLDTPGGPGEYLEIFSGLVARSFLPLAVPRLAGAEAVVSALAALALVVLLVPWIARRTGGHPALVAAAGPCTAALLAALLIAAFGPVEVLGVLALLTVVGIGTTPDRPDPLHCVWATVAVAFLAYHLLVPLLGMRPGYSQWYCAPAHTFWILGLGVAAATLWQLQRDLRGRRFVVAGAALPAAVVAAFGLGAAAGGYPAHALFTARLAAARWIAQHSEPDAVLAAWNAGLLGYFCDRPLVNLDGLINSYDFVRMRREPGFRTGDYLRAEGVDYVIDWVVPDDVLPDLRAERRFPTAPGWNPIVLYRVLAAEPARTQGLTAPRR